MLNAARKARGKTTEASSRITEANGIPPWAQVTGAGEVRTTA